MAITHLSQLDLNQSYTYADYLTWQVKERLELLLGHVRLISPAPNRAHQRISGNLFLILGQHFKQSPCKLFAAPFDVRLPRPGETHPSAVKTVVQPDLCVVCDPAKLDERGCNRAPELVVEILSPGNTRFELREKYRLYESSGVKEYWVVSQSDLSVSRYVLSDSGQYVSAPPLTDLDMIETPLFPGLKVDLAEVFAE